MLRRQLRKPLAARRMNHRAQNDNALGLGGFCRTKRSVEIIRAMHRQNVELYARSAGEALYRSKLLDGTRLLPEDGYPGGAGQGLLEELKPLAAQLIGLEGQPSDAASRSREAGDKPISVRIAHTPHDDGMVLMIDA